MNYIGEGYLLIITLSHRIKKQHKNLSLHSINSKISAYDAIN
jgi:hypothetical protein